MKSKRTKRTKPNKRRSRNKTVKRESKLRIWLHSWGSFVSDAYQLESLLGKKPRQLLIEFVGTGEIPSDTVLLMRSMILKRSPRTRLVTNARSSLTGATVLLWLLGDVRHLRSDAQLRLRPAGRFTPDHVASVWKDRCTCEECEIAEQDYIRVLEGINEFLPVKELAGQAIDVSTLAQYGLVDSEKTDRRLAAVFRLQESRSRRERLKRQKDPTNYAAT